MMDPIAAWPVATTTSGSAARPRMTWEDIDAMKGLMMDYPLTVDRILEREAFGARSSIVVVAEGAKPVDG